MTSATGDERVGASFRDPAGLVFKRDGVVYRQIANSYGPTYDRLMGSGLYGALVDEGLLIPHREVGVEHASAPDAYQVLEPVQLPFVSYPYEWSFSQLRDAALATLAVQRRALEFNLSLKDASAYNLQLLGGRPALIDTLSFEPYEPGYPWVAYRQFGQHFLGPLAVMSYRDVRLSQLLKSNLDGLPLDLAVRLLPWRTRLKPGLLMHLHLHERSQRRHAGSQIERAAHAGQMSPHRMRGLLESLDSTIRGLDWDPHSTPWASYGEADSYDRASHDHKVRLVGEYLAEARPTAVWDIGANTGEFSRIASAHNIPVVSIDSDPGAVELNYRQVTANREPLLFPIVADLTNPSAALGWENREVPALSARGPTDVVLALALVHHLAISNNLALDALAEAFGRLGRALIIEFVPRSDPKTRRLVAMRNHDFPDYTETNFESAFGRLFEIVRSDAIEGMERRLYLMVKRR